MSDVWLFAIEADEVEEEDVMPALVDGREIAVYRVGGEFFATDDRCTHGAANLSEGVVVGDVIECPLHQGRFCVRSGRALSPPVAVPVATYPTRLADGKVYVRLNAPGDGA